MIFFYTDIQPPSLHFILPSTCNNQKVTTCHRTSAVTPSISTKKPWPTGPWPLTSAKWNAGECNQKNKICGAIWRLMGDFVSFSRFVYILPPRRKTLLLFFFYFFPGQERGRHAAYDAGRQASQNTAGPSRTDWRPAGVWLLGQRSDQRCRQYGLFAPLPRSDPPLCLLQRRNHQPPRSVFILKRIKKPHTRFNLTDKHFSVFPNFYFRCSSCGGRNILSFQHSSSIAEKYFEMNKKQCKDALDFYKKFLVRMDRVAEFLKVAENVGIDKGDIPDLTRVRVLVKND